MNEPFSDHHKTLRECLSDWTDVDGAAYDLGRLLGVLPARKDGESEQDHWLRCKSIFWTANALGCALHEGLVGLAAAGLLEREPDPDGVISGSSAFRFTPNPPTEDDPEPPVEIDRTEHYMALAEGLFALRALGIPLADIDSRLCSIHAQFWMTLCQGDQAQLEHDIEVAMHRWKHAGKAK